MPLAHADTRFEAIYFVNRVNFLFDRWQRDVGRQAFARLSAGHAEA
jgi:hypothetical protein